MNIKELKQRISAISGGSAPSADGAFLATGCPQIDASLPARGPAGGALHEMAGAGYRDRPAALGFTLGLTARLLKQKPGPLIWCQVRDRDRLHVHGPGLMAFGIDPGRLTKVTVGREIDLLWALEEALDCPYVAGVVGVLWSEKRYNFTASRRLSLRAKKGGVTALLVRSHHVHGASAAATRWRIASAPGKARWRINLSKRGDGAEKKWDVVWNHEAIRFDLASRVADNAPAAQPLTAVG